jgi:hypothetical protein
MQAGTSAKLTTASMIHFNSEGQGKRCYSVSGKVTVKGGPSSGVLYAVQMGRIAKLRRANGAYCEITYVSIWQSN